MLRPRGLALALVLGLVATAGLASAQPSPPPPPTDQPAPPTTQPAPPPTAPPGPATATEAAKPPPSPYPRPGQPTPVPAAGTAAEPKADPTAPRSGSVMRMPEHLYGRPSGFWTSNAPAVGGAYRYRMLAVGVLVLGITIFFLVRMLRRIDRSRALAGR